MYFLKFDGVAKLNTPSCTRWLQRPIVNAALGTTHLIHISSTLSENVTPVYNKQCHNTCNFSVWKKKIFHCKLASVSIAINSADVASLYTIRQDFIDVCKYFTVFDSY